MTVYKDASEAEKAIQEHIESISELDWPAYMNARRLMRRNDIGKLLEANKLECENLVERWCNEDLPNYLVQYMAKRKSQKPKL